MESTYALFVGIDWATQQHEVSVVDPARVVRDRFHVPHTAEGVKELLARLACYGPPDTVAIGIELTRGQLIEALVQRAYHVYALNPKQSDRFRDRHSVAGAKDDRLDAFVLADSLRTDRPCFHRVQPDAAAVLLLREWSRMEDELREEQGRLSNRLREQLYRYCPQWLALCPAADEPWFWALLELAPTPDVGRRLRRARVAACLRTHRIRRLTADDIAATLRAPAIVVTPGTIAAASAHVALLIPRLTLVHAQRKTCIATLATQLDTLTTPSDGPDGDGAPSDVAIVRSLPGVGMKTVAALLAEASQALAARDLAALRAYTGVAPITRRSGTRCVVHMRHACSGRLRTALYHAARVSAQCDANSREVYTALRARGHSHGRACRTVADRMLRILVAMLRAGTLYQSDHPRAHVAPAAPCAA